MSGKVSTRNPYCLRKRNKKTHNEKEFKLEYEQRAYTSHQNKLKNCNFVGKCLRKAEKKKTKEIKDRNQKISMKNSQSGIKKKFSSIKNYYFSFFIMVLTSILNFN